MSVDRTDLQHVALWLLSPLQQVADGLPARLSDDDWDALDRMLHQHRMRPFLHWFLRQAGQADKRAAVPGFIHDRWDNTHRRTAIRVLSAARELLTMHDILDKGGIPHLSLKGAFLAYHAYPAPAIRPLRDIDLLVPADRVLEAYDLLLANGLTRHAAHGSDPAATIDLSRHLPQLVSASGRMMLDLHSRIIDPCRPGETFTPVSDSPAFWQRAIQRDFGGQILHYPSPTDLLLHLIRHMVYQHQFDAGPLVYTDIAFLLEREEIDWDLFWSLAEEIDSVRGAHLMLDLVEMFWGPRAIRRPDSRAPEHRRPTREVLLQAANMSLRGIAEHGDTRFREEIASSDTVTGRMAFVFRKAFPSPAALAAHYPVPANSPRVLLYYPVKWWEILTSRVPSIVRSYDSADINREAADLRRLNTWLAGDD